MRGHTKSNRGYTPDFHFDLHAVFYLMRLKKAYKGGGGGGRGHEHPTALRLCLLGCRGR